MRPLLSTCGCCEPADPGPPPAPWNPPGQRALAYRVRTHPGFLAALASRLARNPDTAALTVRDADDVTIALLDAWAATLDVLAFYSERIANEGFLRTATETRSVQALAAAVGYHPRPGLAARTHLAFELETAPGSPAAVELAAGLAMQSVPEGDEEPQTFETVEALEARGEWTAMRAATGREQRGADELVDVVVEGSGSGLQAGDALLLLDPHGAPDDADGLLCRIGSVQPDPARAVTRLVLADRRDLGGGLGGRPVGPGGEVTAHALRQRAALFGQTAPDWRAMPETVKTEYDGEHATDWPGLHLDTVGRREGTHAADVIHLDAAYPKVVAGGLLVLAADGGPVRAYAVAETAETAISDFATSAKVTRVQLSADRGDFNALVRETTVLAASEPLTLAPWVDDSPLAGDRIPLAAPVAPIPAGRTVYVSGRAAADGREVGLLRTTDAPPETDAQAELVLAAPIGDEVAGGLDRTTVRVNANVAAATHGESREEVLGGGSAAAFESFALGEGPLTYLQADIPAGARSTLTLRVDGLAWDEAGSLHDAGPEDRSYTLRRDADGRATVAFGDGRRGRRPPRGEDNVTARYRVGAGRAGNVGAERLTVLLAQPLGVTGVTNPVPATGGDDPEPLEAMRAHAPLEVRTFDRVVSLADFADFADAFPGIGTACATWLWDGQRRIVHVTATGPGGALLDEARRAELAAALRTASDGLQPFRVDAHTARCFVVRVLLHVEEAHEPEAVREAVTDLLRATYDKAIRPLATPVRASDVVALLHRVDAVKGVELAAFHDLDEAEGVVVVMLPARPARSEDGTVRGAELLAVAPERVEVEVAE